MIDGVSKVALTFTVMCAIYICMLYRKKEFHISSPPEPLRDVGPDQHTDPSHLLALLLYHELHLASVGHREPDTVVLHYPTDLEEKKDNLGVLRMLNPTWGSIGHVVPIISVMSTSIPGVLYELQLTIQMIVIIPTYFFIAPFKVAMIFIDLPGGILMLKSCP